MLDVLIQMLCCEAYAHDLHYRASGESFYGLHLLADKVNFGTAMDDLKEAWFLLPNNILPTEADLVKMQLEAMNKDVPHDNAGLVSRLSDGLNTLIYTVEEAKRTDGLIAGVHAILDGISQNALIAFNLCRRTLEEEKKDGTEIPD